jgi:ParB-like chromosome segregation protein Spo0J
MAESTKVNGWQGPPVQVVEVNGKRYVVDGHHRLAAAKQAGIKVNYEVGDPSTVIGQGQWSSVDDIVRDANSVGPDKIRTK